MISAERTFSERVEFAANFIRSRTPRAFDTLVILGSGLRGAVDAFSPYGKIDFNSIPYMPTASAPGHESSFYFAENKGGHPAMSAGRFHFYEGYNFEEIAFPVFVFKKLGIKKLILTNASGGLTEKITPGEPVWVTDFLNLYGTGGAFPVIEKEPDKPFFRRKAEKYKNAETGVYAYMPGPSFGTAAEYRMLKHLGADMVGMSTWHEAVAAHRLGLSVEVISVPVCTYHTADDLKEPGEEEVIAASAKALPAVLKMINQII